MDIKAEMAVKKQRMTPRMVNVTPKMTPKIEVTF